MDSVFVYKITIFSIDCLKMHTILGLPVGEVRTLQHLKGVFCMKPEGEIESGKAYTLDRFMEITKIKRFAMDSARKNGLVVRKAGRRCFVLGQDFLDYLTSSETVQT